VLMYRNFVFSEHENSNTNIFQHASDFEHGVLSVQKTV
jgi:hypothetical protein